MVSCLGRGLSVLVGFDLCWRSERRCAVEDIGATHGDDPGGDSAEGGSAARSRAAILAVETLDSI